MSKPLVVLAVLVAASGCAGGIALRSPDVYRDDTKQLFESKTAEMRACYDEILKGTPGVQGRVTIRFDVLTQTGKITNVVVDPAQTTAPEPMQGCVRKVVETLALNPPDAQIGQGVWTFDFTAPPAPPPAAAAPPAPGKS